MGRFHETFNFSVPGSAQNLKFSILGEVVRPTEMDLNKYGFKQIHFDPSLIQFEDVSTGFEASQNCRINNESFFPVEFKRINKVTQSLSRCGVSVAFDFRFRDSNKF